DFERALVVTPGDSCGFDSHAIAFAHGLEKLDLADSAAEPFFAKAGHQRTRHVAVVGDTQHERASEAEPLRQPLFVHPVARSVTRVVRHDPIRLADAVGLRCAHTAGACTVTSSPSTLNACGKPSDAHSMNFSASAKRGSLRRSGSGRSFLSISAGRNDTLRTPCGVKTAFAIR